MKLFQRLFDFYINASVHVALAVTSLTLITYLTFKLAPSESVLLLVFFGSISGYNFVKYAPIAKMYHRSLAKSLKTIQVFSFCTTAVGVYILTTLPLSTSLWLLMPMVLTALYVIPFLKAKNLRRMSGLKIFVVGMVWSWIAIVLPLVEAGMNFNWDWLLHLAQLMLLVIVWTLPFEIRDLPYDANELRTIPQIIGVKNTKWIGRLALVVVVLADIYLHDYNPARLFSFSAMMVLSAVLLELSSKKQSRYFSSFWVESIPIFWMLIFLFLCGYFDSSC